MTNGSMDDRMQGLANGRTAAMTQRVMRCSNEDCKFHKSDAVFEQHTLVSIIYDVLRPGQFAPAMVGLRNVCTGCGWIFGMEEGGAKPKTVPPGTSND